jgi:hypothetical protein
MPKKMIYKYFALEYKACLVLEEYYGLNPTRNWFEVSFEL